MTDMNMTNGQTFEMNSTLKDQNRTLKRTKDVLDDTDPELNIAL